MHLKNVWNIISQQTKNVKGFAMLLKTYKINTSIYLMNYGCMGIKLKPNNYMHINTC